MLVRTCYLKIKKVKCEKYRSPQVLSLLASHSLNINLKPWISAGMIKTDNCVIKYNLSWINYIVLELQGLKWQKMYNMGPCGNFRHPKFVRDKNYKMKLNLLHSAARQTNHSDLTSNSLPHLTTNKLSSQTWSISSSSIIFIKILLENHTWLHVPIYFYIVLHEY